jgi:UPF0755 protein
MPSIDLRLRHGVVSPREISRFPRILIAASLSVLIAIVVGFSAFVAFAMSPRGGLSTAEAQVVIPAGGTAEEIAQVLKSHGVIRSETAFLLYARWDGGDELLQAGRYALSPSLSLPEVYAVITQGVGKVPDTLLVIPEGFTNSGIADRIEHILPGFDKEEFLRIAEPLSGQLFPETYAISSSDGPQEIIERMRQTFAERTRELQGRAKEQGLDWNEVLTMASIIEREAAHPEDRRMISGILWKRLAQGMRLQVDAPFATVLGKSSADLTADDLESDAAFNTYRHDGLPPVPIANPGLDAIEAAIVPRESDLLFYLSDGQGVTHYARTFEEHKLNKERYLR